MKLSITGSESYTLAGQVIDKLIRTGDGDAALLYLYILRTQGRSTDEQAAAALGKGKGQIAAATALLSRMGLIEIATDTAEVTPAPEPAAEPRRYTQDEVVAELESNTEFTTVVNETERRLGKPLSPDELLRLYGIYDDLRLPPEVILQLITHCISQCRRKGDGRMPSVRYIEKAAYTWQREGIYTIEKAEEYLKQLEAAGNIRAEIKQVMQINDRELSDIEKGFVDNWIRMGFDKDAIKAAYDKTIINTGKRSYAYMDTILRKWNEKGLHNAQSLQAAETGRSKNGTYDARTSRHRSTQKHGEPSSEQILRMTRILDNMNDE